MHLTPRLTTFLILGLCHSLGIAGRAFAADASSPPSLPEFYGVYASHGGQWVELSTSQQARVFGTANFLNFQRGPAVGDLEIYKMPTAEQQRQKPKPRNNGSLSDFAASVEANADRNMRALSGIPEGQKLKLRAKPAPGQKDMTIFVPDQPLEPGLYRIRWDMQRENFPIEVVVPGLSGSSSDAEVIAAVRTRGLAASVAPIAMVRDGTSDGAPPLAARLLVETQKPDKWYVVIINEGAKAVTLKELLSAEPPPSTNTLTSKLRSRVDAGSFVVLGVGAVPKAGETADLSCHDYPNPAKFVLEAAPSASGSK